MDPQLHRITPILRRYKHPLIDRGLDLLQVGRLAAGGDAEALAAIAIENRMVIDEAAIAKGAKPDEGAIAKFAPHPDLATVRRIDIAANANGRAIVILFEDGTILKEEAAWEASPSTDETASYRFFVLKPVEMKPWRPNPVGRTLNDSVRLPGAFASTIGAEIVQGYAIEGDKGVRLDIDVHSDDPDKTITKGVPARLIHARLMTSLPPIEAEALRIYERGTDHESAEFRLGRRNIVVSREGAGIDRQTLIRIIDNDKGWELNEIHGSLTRYTRYVFKLARALPQTMLDALAEKPFGSIVDMPDDYREIGALVIDKAIGLGDATVFDLKPDDA